MSESCCTVSVVRAQLPTCPECGKLTKAVDITSVRHHVLPQLVGTLHGEQYGFCETPTCPVVYVVEGKPALRKTDLRTRVSAADSGKEAQTWQER